MIFYNNDKFEEEVNVDLTKVLLVLYKQNSTLVEIYSSTGIKKVYLMKINGIQKFLKKSLYHYNDCVYFNLNNIVDYNDYNDCTTITFNNGAVYTLDVNETYIKDFELAWRSFKITNFYKNDI